MDAIEIEQRSIVAYEKTVRSHETHRSDSTNGTFGQFEPSIYQDMNVVQGR